MFGEHMKFIAVLILIVSFQLFPDICFGEDSFEKKEIGIGGYTIEDLVLNREKVISILNESKKKHDHRKIYNKDSDELLETYGKLKIDGVQKCTANIVTDNFKNDSIIVTTAAHCFKPGDEDKNITVEFTKRDGKTIARTLSMEIKNTENDYAILKLDRKILKSEIKPLVISEYDAYDIEIELEMFGYDEIKMTLAGFSADSLFGDDGGNLTYDQDCVIVGVGRGYDITTNCFAYPGASGGAFVISYDDYDDGVRKNLFLGVNKSISLDPYDKKKPWRTTFVDHSIMYDDLMKALAK